MEHIIRRLFSRPVIGFELLLATVCANALALATPIFVIQVLNRYVAFGVDTTLATLAAGAVIAVLFEFAFRRVRVHLAERAVAPFDDTLTVNGFEALVQAPLSLMTRLSVTTHHHAVGGADTVRQAYGPTNLLVFMDVPFALFFIAVLWVLSPMMASIAAGYALLVLLLGLSTLVSLHAPTLRQQWAVAVRGQLATSAIKAPETVRMFDASGLMQRQWHAVQNSLMEAQSKIASRQDFVQTATQSLTALLTITMISAGAYLVVSGKLDIGVLIGANILGARCIAPIAKMGGVFRVLVSARQADTVLDELDRVPRERQNGTELKAYKGAITFDDVSFAYPGSRSPLFEQLSIEIAAGQTLAVAGHNGSGKSTLGQLIAGLREPIRGRVLADGVDLTQMQPSWWRQQVRYLPQEPRFLPGTIRDNLMAANPEISEESITELIEEAGLSVFIDESSEGLDMRITDGGDSLALGIRRRLALARAMAVQGPLMLVDEPTEGLDEQGRNIVYAAMNRHAKAGGTIIACSHDPQILKGADWMVDLSHKPKPRVLNLKDKTLSQFPVPESEAGK